MKIYQVDDIRYPGHTDWQLCFVTKALRDHKMGKNCIEWGLCNSTILIWSQP